MLNKTSSFQVNCLDNNEVPLSYVQVVDVLLQVSVLAKSQ